MKYVEHGNEKKSDGEIQKPYRKLWYQYGKCASYGLESQKRRRLDQVIIGSPVEVGILDNVENILREKK